MITYRRAEQKDFSSLKDLWSVVFNEEPTFLEKFFSTRFDERSIFLAEENNTIVAALHALRSSYTKQGVSKPCSFIVGAATLETYRKRGIMSELLKLTSDSIDDPITLFPAVRPYYEKNGYFTTSSVVEYAIAPSLTLEVRQEGFAYTDLNRIYTEATSPTGSLDRDELAWSFLTDGYESVAVKDGYAFLLNGKAVEAMALTEEAARSLLGILARRGVTTIHVLPNSPFEALLSNGTSVPMGMATDKALEGLYIAEQY